MNFMMNETFIHVMDKFNEELQLHVLGYTIVIVHNCKKLCIEWCELSNPPYYRRR
jgi:hypothetical protein